MDEIIKRTLLEYFFTSPIWILSLCCIFLQGKLLHMIILGYTKKLKKYNKKIYSIALGAGCSCASFLILNFKLIINSSLTFENIKEKILSSIFFSFALIGIIAIIILPLREKRNLKGNEPNGKKS